MRDLWNELAPRRRRARRNWRPLLTTGAGVLGGALVVGALAAALTGLSAANQSTASAPALAQVEIGALRNELDDVRGRLALAEVRLEHMNAVAKYSTLYGVPSDLASAIYDIALAEGIHPSLGFQLVKVESRFQSAARSPSNAIGYTQLRLPTARMYDSTVTERKRLERDTNRRLEFAFMKNLRDRFGQDRNLALLPYNRAPPRGSDMMPRGRDPGTGYAAGVRRGVKGIRPVKKGS